MQKALNVKTAEKVYEVMVEKIYQIPSALVLRDWQEVNVEFYEFIKEVGMNPLFKEPLLVLNSILLFGIAEDYELGYNIATPIYNNIKNRKGFSSMYELKLFIRVSFLLCRNFEDLKELSKYAFDFLESSDNGFTYETPALICNIMYALVKMNQKDYLENKEEIKEEFENLYSSLKSMAKEYKLKFYLDYASTLYEEFKIEERRSDELVMEEVMLRYRNFVEALDNHTTKFHNGERIENLSLIFQKIKEAGGKL